VGAAALLLASLLPACVAYVDYGAGGYQRSGVWFPPREEPRWAGPVAAPPVEAVELEWSSELGVYGVRSEVCTFYRLRTFYRWSDEGWQRATTLEGPWRSCPRAALPPGLRTDPGTLCPPEGASSP
jgi:hypothetical protein